jgi:membrane associated rhomboid family serine protease
MFLIIPVGVQYTARRYPVVTFTLMGINVTLYLVSLVMFWMYADADEAQREWMVFHLGLIPDHTTWYTFFTSMFVHGGFFHILGNMTYLFLFGSCVEDTIGRWQFTLFYFAGGLAAAVTYLIAAPAGPQGAIPMVGASGAITACIGAFVFLLAKTKINFRYLILFFFRLFSGDFWLPAWVVISFWFANDLFWAVVSYHVPEANDGVAFAAHVGGFVGGAAMIGGWKLFQRYRPAEKVSADVPQSMDAPVLAEPDPNEAPSVYLSQDGNQLGPFTPSQVSQMLALGSIGPRAFFWRDGMADWRSVAEFGRE